MTAIKTRIEKKGALLLALEEPILVAKLLEIPHKRSPPTLRLDSATEIVDPRKLMRKSISIAQIAKVANMTDWQCVRKMLRSL